MERIELILKLSTCAIATSGQYGVWNVSMHVILNEKFSTIKVLHIQFYTSIYILNLPNQIYFCLVLV